MTECVLYNERAGAFCLSIESSDFASGSRNESKRSCIWNPTTKLVAGLTTSSKQFHLSVHHRVIRYALGQGNKSNNSTNNTLYLPTNCFCNMHESTKNY